MQTLTWILMLAGGAGYGAASAGFGLAAVYVLSDDLAFDSDRNIRRRAWGKWLLRATAVGAVSGVAGIALQVVEHAVPWPAALGLGGVAAFVTCGAILLTYVNGRAGAGSVRA